MFWAVIVFSFILDKRVLRCPAAPIVAGSEFEKVPHELVKEPVEVSEGNKPTEKMVNKDCWGSVQDGRANGVAVQQRRQRTSWI